MTTKMVRGVEHLSCEVRLRKLGLIVQPAEEKAVERPYCSLSQEAYEKAGERRFACSDWTRDNSSKLKEGRFRQDIKKNFFATRIVGYWTR